MNDNTKVKTINYNGKKLLVSHSLKRAKTTSKYLIESFI